MRNAAMKFTMVWQSKLTDFVFSFLPLHPFVFTLLERLNIDRHFCNVVIAQVARKQTACGNAHNYRYYQYVHINIGSTNQFVCL